MNYYNENDPNAAAWLRELIRRGVIPAGWVDERSIVDVQPENLHGYTQCHFFAGIGGWSEALALWRAGRRTGGSGRGAVRASRSVSRAKGKGSGTGATSGRRWRGSSPSAALQSCLESRLRARLGVDGSPEYVLTWRSWAMRSGPPICALRGSARRICDSGCIGEALAPWPTATVSSGDYQMSRGRKLLKLAGTAKLAPWTTPAARDHKGVDQQFAKGVLCNSLPNQVRGLVGWFTSNAQDYRGNHSQCWAQAIKAPISGPTATGSPVSTERRGGLNPAHSRWLMGFRPVWDDCAVTAMPSSRKSPRSSSKGSKRR